MLAKADNFPIFKLLSISVIGAILFPTHQLSCCCCCCWGSHGNHGAPATRRLHVLVPSSFGPTQNGSGRRAHWGAVARNELRRMLSGYCGRVRRSLVASLTASGSVTARRSPFNRRRPTCRCRSLSTLLHLGVWVITQSDYSHVGRFYTVISLFFVQTIPQKPKQLTELDIQMFRESWKRISINWSKDQRLWLSIFRQNAVSPLLRT